ncbi:MAG: MraY family glycosyltransferase [Nitrospiraceae bacterium]
MPLSSILFFSFICSLSICMALIPVLMANAHRLQFVDMPDARKQHAQPIARVGGVGIALGTIAAILLWMPKDSLVLGTVLGGVTIFVFGLWDDRADLHYGIKFGGQILAALLAIEIGGVQLHSLPFMEDAVLPAWIGLPLTLLCIIAVTNAINLSDGLDGLAGGLSLLSLLAMAYLAHLAEENTLTIMIVAMSGGLLGFLRFNTYPARIFMGDGGSQFLGFNLAVAAIVLTDVEHGPYSTALIPLLLGLPVLDTVGVMGQRLLEGRSPFKADRNHMHHKLMSLGWTHYETVVLIYLVQGILVGLACPLRLHSDSVTLGVYMLFASMILSTFLVAKPGGGWQPLVAKTHLVSSSLLTAERTGGWWSRLPIRLLWFAVPGALLIGTGLPLSVPSDMSWLAGGLLILLSIGWLAAPQYRPWLVRSGLYIGSIFLAYSIETTARAENWTSLVLGNLGLLAIGAFVVCAIRFDDAHRFRTTPLDYLVVFLAFMAALLPELQWEGIPLGSLAAKLTILFFSFELLLHSAETQVRRLAVLAVCILAGLVLRLLW